MKDIWDRGKNTIPHQDPEYASE